MISLFDTKTPLEPLKGAIAAAIANVLEDGRFILGPEVTAFEAEFAAACGSAESVGVANGTDALELALRGVGVGPGDEVVVPSFTFYATAEAVPPTGATPVFCDVDPDTGCITAETVKAVLTPKTKAVVAVDLFGNVAPVPQIEALGVPVVEDAAQAAGATLCDQPAGSLGLASSFSFFPSKNLGAFGDGGAVVTSDPEVAQHVRTLRFHGSKDKKTFDFIGRRNAARFYDDAGIAEHVTPMVAVDGANPAWHLFVVKHPRAEELIAPLREAGVEARGYYRSPVHKQPAMSEWGSGIELPGTDELAKTNLAIPISPVLEAGQAAQVVEALGNAISALP
ncbi:MAG: DegT/DnrJ/EryC1/StrS family aminotransferase [Solirubrobacterales bacterium]|nr:DegT/DnrJ/EryC1/StrS family aminotransferase [Solirubrobacterales bacterium]